MKLTLYLENYVAGGVDTVIADTLAHWPEPSDEVVLLCNPTHAGLELLRRRAGRALRVEPLPALALPEIHRRCTPSVPVLGPLVRGLLKLLLYYGRYLLFVWNVRRLEAYFAREKPDAVLIHNGGYPGADTARAAAVGARRAGVPKVFMVVHNLAHRPQSLRAPFEALVDRAVDASARIVCVSADSAAVLRRNRRIRREPVVLPNGTADVRGAGAPDRAALRAGLGLDAGTLALGMVGSYDERKGHADLFAALERLRARGRLAGARCLVFGRGEAGDEGRLRGALRGAGLEDVVRLCGFRPDVHRLYAAFDLFVQPSRAFESLPMTVLEAMSAGVAVVATDVGGVREMVADGRTGLLLPAGAPERLAEALDRLLADADLRAAMGRAGRLRYEAEFTAERMARRYRELLSPAEGRARASRGEGST